MASDESVHKLLWQSYFNMIIPLLLMLSSFFEQETLPYKPNDEFEMKLNYDFKYRGSVEGISTKKPVYDSSEDNKRSGPLPYLVINFKLIKLLEDEVRVKVVTNQGKTILVKKVEQGDSFKLDLGYTDDMKDRVTAYHYSIIFLNKEKIGLRIINLEIQEDGTFLLNDEKRGKF